MDGAQAGRLPNIMLADKRQIRHSFSRAALTYDKQALVQRRVAGRLLDLLEASGCSRPGHVLEIGCCTGLLSQTLVHRFGSMAALHLNDLADELFPLVRRRIADFRGSCSFLGGDFESVPIPGRYDLVVSSSTFHWFHDLEHALEKTAGLLKPKGFLALSLFGPDNLRELRILTGKGLDYISLDSLRDLLEERFLISACEEERQRVYFATVDDLLVHLRQSGVNCLSTKGWSRTALERFREEYELRFRETKGVGLTYHPMYIIARRQYPAGRTNDSRILSGNHEDHIHLRH